MRRGKWGQSGVRRHGRWPVFFLWILLTAGCIAKPVQAGTLAQSVEFEYESEYEMEYESGYEPDYSDIQAVIDSLAPEYSISFGEIVGQLLSGHLTASVESLSQYVYEHIFLEIAANKSALLQMISIAVIGAVFTSFSVAFAKNYVAQTGFYITYMILFSMLSASFFGASAIAVQMLEFLVSFMSALMPAFCAAVAFAAGSASASGFYSVFVLAIAMVDWLICKGLIHLIQIYLILSLINNLSAENYLSRLAGLLRTVISWSLKTVLGLTLGLNLIQSLVLPAFDSFKGSLLMRLSSAIPGIGNAMNAAARAAIGSGVLLKNAIGVGGVIVLLILCALPLLKLVVIALMYKVAEAVVQPVSDERVAECIRVTADSIVLLLMAAGTAVLLFILSLAVITSSSNLKLGG